MTITYHGGNIIRGTAADRTGGTWTNLQSGYLFIESDTQLIYYWNGTAWTKAGGDATGSNTYTLYQAGTTIKAKNGITGAIDYSGDASVDCIPTIQSAIDNIYLVGSDSDVETGGIIKLLKGSYKCITSLELNASRTNARRGIQFRGEGSGTLLNFIPTGALTYGILIRSDYTGLRDFRIKGNTNVGNLIKAISSTSNFSDRVNIFNVQFQGANAWASLAPVTGQNGIWRDASTAGSIKLYWWKIIGCSFDSLDKGIVGTGGANDTSMQIEACDFYDCTTGIELFANEHIINNCWFQGDTSYGVTGVHITGTSDQNIITNVVHELRKTATNCQGVLLDSGAQHNRVGRVFSGYNDNNLVVGVRDNSGNTTNIKSPDIYRGLSSDTKSVDTEVMTNSLYYETDTRVWYIYNGTTWSPMSIKYNDLAKTANYTLLTTDDILRADASAGAFTLTLPTAVGATGKIYTIKRTDILSSSNVLTIATTSSQTIGGAPNEYLMPAEYLLLESDGSNWQTVGRTSGFPSYLKGVTANRRYLAGGLPGFTPIIATTTTAPAIDTLWALPLVVQTTTKFDAISFRLASAAAAGGVARAGIYRDTGNCYPGKLIFDTLSIDVTTGAGKDTTITSGLQVFPAGLYWLAWECGVAAPQIKGLNGITNLMNIMGSDNVNNNNGGFGYSVAHSFGALPDPYTGSATILNTTPSPTVPVPAVGLRPI